MSSRLIGKIACAAIATLALSTSAWAEPATSAARQSGQPSSNLQLFRDVQRQVLRYERLSIFDNIKAHVSDGVVTLSGKVTMPYKRQEIEQRVAKLKTITKINNRIEVLPVSRFDDDLRIGIARAIYSNPLFERGAVMINPPINIIVENGRVTLEGIVDSDLDKVVAKSIASSSLAFSVKSNLKTQAEAKEALEKL